MSHTIEWSTLQTSRAEKPRSATRRISEEKLAQRLANRLEHECSHLFKLLESGEKYPEEATERFVYASLSLSPARYKGYNAEELMQVVKAVIALVQSKGEEKPQATRSDPKNQIRTPKSTTTTPRGHATHVSSGPAKPPRPLTKRQEEQAAKTPPPPPVANIAATHTTRGKGLAKRVPREEPTRNDLEIVRTALDELFEHDQELKDACQASAIDRNDERIRTVATDLVGDKRLDRPGKIDAYIKKALAELAKKYAHEATSKPPTKPIVTTVAQPSPKPMVKAPPTKQEKPPREPLSPEMQAKFDRLGAQPTDSSPTTFGDAHLSEVGKEKNERALAWLQSLPK